MELIFKPIKQLITPQFQEAVSNKLRIDGTILIKLSDLIIAGLFGALLAKGDNSETEKALKTFVFDVNNDKEMEGYLLDDNSGSGKIEAVTTLADAILLGRRKEFKSILAALTEQKEEQIENVIISLTYTIGLDLGQKLLTNEYTITGLLGQIHAERNFFLGYIPSEMISILGVPSLLAIGHNLSSDAKVVSDAVYHEIMLGNTPVKEDKNTWRRWFSFKAAL